jgi:hypothetical protein
MKKGRSGASQCVIVIAVIEEWVVDMHLDPVKGDDGLHCTAKTPRQIKNP